MQIIAQIEFKMTKMEILERFFSKIIYLIYLDIKTRNHQGSWNKIYYFNGYCIVRYCINILIP